MKWEIRRGPTGDHYGGGDFLPTLRGVRVWNNKWNGGGLRGPRGKLHFLHWDW